MIATRSTSSRRRITASLLIRWFGVVSVIAGARPIPAQRTVGTVDFRAVTGTDAQWPLTEAAPTESGFLTIVALTPSTRGFAVQILYPRSPSDSGWVAKGEFKRPAPFRASYISHRVATGGVEVMPVVMAFLTPAPADLLPLIRGGEWAQDAFVKMEVDSTTDFAATFATMAFASPDALNSIAVYSDRATPICKALRKVPFVIVTVDEAGRGRLPRSAGAGDPRIAELRAGAAQACVDQQNEPSVEQRLRKAQAQAREEARKQAAKDTSRSAAARKPDAEGR